MAISGTQFQSDDDIIHAVEDFLESQEKDFFKSGSEALQHHWQNCIDIEGDYVEKQYNMCMFQMSNLYTSGSQFFNQHSYISKFILDSSTECQKTEIKSRFTSYLLKRDFWKNTMLSKIHVRIKQELS